MSKLRQKYYCGVSPWTNNIVMSHLRQKDYMIKDIFFLEVINVKTCQLVHTLNESPKDFDIKCVRQSPGLHTNNVNSRFIVNIFLCYCYYSYNQIHN